ncbi:MAG: hypothetical protein RDU14_17705 [Melioribacteraceae bacterium]|nr:hypothetical protein [Melioribacteraceae bacterium]
MQKFRLIFIALCMAIFFGGLFAQHRPFGLGVSIGEPTGVNAKLWTSETGALDFGVGWSIGGDRIGSYEGQYNGGRRIHFHFDYMLHLFDAVGSTGQFPIYYGIGGRFNAGAGYLSSLAVRFVVGLAWMPRESPIDMFIEFVPSLQLTSLPGLAIDSAIGIRYYF